MEHNFDLERGALAAVTLGAAGIVVTSACYAVSPTTLALPIPTERLPEALEAVGDPRRAVLALGGAIGTVGDVVFAAGALVLATRTSSGARALAWTLAALAATIFVVVDALAWRGLAADASFELAKRLFDALFVVGTAAFAIGVLLFAEGAHRPAHTIAFRAAGVLGACAALGAFAGADVGQALGIFIGLGALMFTLEGGRAWRAAVSFTHTCPSPVRSELG